MSLRGSRLLWLWGGLLAALLCFLFLPLTAGESGLAIVLIMTVVIAALVAAGRRPGGLPEGEYGLNDLPEAPYPLPVVLVCGDTPDWPGEGVVYRTAQGCWLKVSTAQLQQTVRHLLRERPELAAELAVMVCVCPQQHDDETVLTARLHELRWQLAQVRGDARRTVPLLLTSSVAGASVTQTLWQSLRAGKAPQVWQADEAPCNISRWISQDDTAFRTGAQVRINAQARFIAEAVLPALTAESPDMPPAVPAMVLYHQTPSAAAVVMPDSLWSRWLARHTTLKSLPGWLPGSSSPDDTPFPDFILPLLPQGGGIAPRSPFLRRAFCLFTLAVLVTPDARPGWSHGNLFGGLGHLVAPFRSSGVCPVHQLPP